jgi:hypothetical protein
MTGVMLGQSVVPTLLFTMRGHVRPIGGNECRGWDPVAFCLARGLHASLERGRSMPRGSGTAVLTLQWSGEAEIIPSRAQGSAL